MDGFYVFHVSKPGRSTSYDYQGKLLTESNDVDALVSLAKEAFPGALNGIILSKSRTLAPPFDRPIGPVEGRYRNMPIPSSLYTALTIAFIGLSLTACCIKPHQEAHASSHQWETISRR